MVTRTKTSPTTGEETPPPALERHIPALDGLRGVAILLVMGYHFFEGALYGRPHPVAIDRLTLRVAGTGWSGVDLFFVLSGFLITGILYDSRAKAGRYFGNFYMRRVLRIFPLYYLFLVLVVVLVPLVQPADRPAIEALGHHKWWYLTYMTNYRALFQPFLTTDFIVTGHLWSLAVEEQFYLVWPALVLLLPRRGLIVVCLATIVLAPFLRLALDLTGVDRSVVYEMTPTRIDSLAIGAAIALVARHPGGLSGLRRLARPVGVIAGATLLVLFVTRDGLPMADAWVQTVGFTALGMFSGALIVSVLRPHAGAPPATVFHNGILRSFGRYSYALYLFHGPIALLLARRVDIPASVFAIDGSLLPGALVFSAVAGGISVAAAVLSWHLFERQVLKLKSRFPYTKAPPSVRLPRPSPARA